MGKKHFNNLYDSIILTLLLVAGLFLLITSTYYFACYNGWKAALISLSLWGSMCIVVVLLILCFAYEYWIIYNDRIILKKMIGKPKTIFRDQITNVYKKKVPSILSYVCDGYVVESKSTHITIILNKKNKDVLDEYFRNNVM